MIPILTLFSAPKPFTNPHVRMIQRNAIQSWIQLGLEVQVILIGEEEGLAETAEEFNIQHLPDVGRNTNGTPMVSSIFELARNVSQSPILAYINADIITLPDFLDGAKKAAELTSNFLLVGQRWDLDVRTAMDFGPQWIERLENDLKNRGRLHARGGSDYFIFPRGCFLKIPDFAIGRAGWDNWMIYECRRKGWPCVDATETIRVIHQDHDYSHLPQGKPHYRLPETFVNVKLAGGRRTIFSLLDTNKRLVNDKLQPVKPNWKKFWRDVETFPLVGLHSYPLGQAAYAAFHPMRAYREFRLWLKGNHGELK